MKSVRGQDSKHWTAHRLPTNRALRGQDSTEYIILFAIAMILMLGVVVFLDFWPNFTQGAQKQRADDYWAAAKPFAIRGTAMYPNQLAMEITNSGPVTLTVRSVYLDGTPLAIYNHSIPFSWASTSQCSGNSTCSMRMMPGERRVITTVNFTANPQNPCVSGSAFLTSYYFGMNLTITYNASDGTLHNETSFQKIMGMCTER